MWIAYYAIRPCLLTEFYAAFFLLPVVAFHALQSANIDERTTMSYSSIHSIIQNWTKKHQLVLYSRYQDADVRSVEIVDGTGNRYQIWVEEPKGEHVGVHAWDYRRQRSDWQTTRKELENCLDEARAMVLKWSRSTN